MNFEELTRQINKLISDFESENGCRLFESEIVNNKLKLIFHNETTRKTLESIGSNPERDAHQNGDSPMDNDGTADSD